MSEAREKSPAAQETAPAMRNEFFAPVFPFGRFLGLSPFSLMREFSDEMERMFRGAAPLNNRGAWVPAVDIQQCNGAMIVTAELPGLKKEEVKVALTHHALVIEGERKREHDEHQEGFHRWERSYGQFYRSIPLPEGAQIDQAKAELADGVLKISLPVEGTKKTVRRVAIGQKRPRRKQ